MILSGAKNGQTIKCNAFQLMVFGRFINRWFPPNPLILCVSDECPPPVYFKIIKTSTLNKYIGVLISDHNVHIISDRVFVLRG